MPLYMRRPKAFMVFIGLAALGFFIYANAIPHPFVHDDIAFIQLNPNIARWDNILEAFIHPGVPFAEMRISTPYYRPFLEVLYRLQYSIFGLNPHGFHFFNIILHILTAGLAVTAARLFGLPRLWAVAVAVLFLVHPVQSEAVACVSGISNLAVAVPILLAFIFYARSRMIRRYRLGSAGFLAGGCFVLALITKELAVVFPAFVLAYEISHYRTKRLSGAVWSIVLFFAMAGIYLFWRGHIFPGHLGSAFANLPEFWLRVLAIPRTFLDYLGLIFWPAGLHYYRSTDILTPPGISWGIFAALLAAGVWIVRAMPKRMRRAAILGMVWGVIFLVPGFNIVPLINEYSLVLSAEHFLYLSLVGFLVTILTLLRWILRPIPQKFWLSAAVIVAVVFCGMTIRQNTFWRGEVPLFERAVLFQPELGRVHILLARAYAHDARFAEAVSEYTKGLNIMRDYVTKSRHPEAREAYLQFIKAIHRDLGDIFRVMGDPHRSIQELRASLSIRLDHLSALDTGVDDSMTANNLGMVFLMTGDRAHARRWWQASVRMNSRNPDAFNNLGMMALERGDKATATFFFKKALMVMPGSISVTQNLFRAERM